MNISETQNHSLKLWYLDNGNNTHAINYNLNEESIVVDFGGYEGVWADQIIEKYNPYVFLFEPVSDFYIFLVDKFKNNKKVKIFNYALGIENKKDIIFLNGDGTSKYINHGNTQEVEFIDINKMFELIQKDTVDLVQINIEGEEYSLLNDMITKKTINKFKNLQIQYHIWIDDAENKRINIQEKMKENFQIVYEYPFIFEGWTIKNKI